MEALTELKVLANNAWILMSTALVMLMIPGLGYFYSGISHQKNALGLIHVCMLSLAIVSIQWFIWGFSLSFSPNGGPFIGDVSTYGGLTNLANQQISSISMTVFCLYQNMFAAITPALAIGAAADRSRITPLIFFIFIWTTVVYDPLAYWTWAPNGWLLKLGSLDFAGGTPVHISSGFAALAFSLIVGHRKNRDHNLPHNLGFVVLGTSLLWFGWFGFNGGSTLDSSSRSGMTMIVTNISASAGGLTWMILDAFKTKKYSALSFCVGVVAGLVTITPASGFVPPWSGIVFGVIGATTCRFATMYQPWMRIDDTLDVWAVHGVGGVVGNILTGVFAQQWIATLNGTSDPLPGGWMNQIWMQVPIQLAASAAGAAWSFGVTAVMLLLMDRIPGLRLRLKEDHEIQGLDLSQMGESVFTAVHDDESVSIRVPSISETGRHSGELKRPGYPQQGSSADLLALASCKK